MQLVAGGGTCCRATRARAGGEPCTPRAAPALVAAPRRRSAARLSFACRAEAATAAPVGGGEAEAYSKLQNGSDVRGVALAGVPKQDVTLTPARAANIAAGFVGWLSAATGTPAARLRVSVGRDPRLSGEAMAAAVFAGIASAGATPVDMSLATTPACFMSCITPGHAYDGSIMLTASHLPWNRNGMKFFSAKGGLGKADIKDILQRATALHAAAPAPALAPATPPARVNFLAVYAAQLRDLICRGVQHPTAPQQPLTGFKIVVDAGNGSGGFFASQVLAPLGADVAGSQFLEPDGRFPNHIPNPEEPEAIASATQAVLAARADLGIVFDTDVDRSAVIDRAGTAINRNRLIALLAAIVLRERPGATIVTDSVTSDGLGDFIRAAGGKHLRFKRGYKNVIDKGLELAAAGVDAPLMIETSGHGAMAENRYLDDGAYLAVKVVIEAARRRLAGTGDIDSLLASLREPADEAEYRIPIGQADFRAAGGAALEALHAAVAGGAFPGWELEAENYEGYRVRVDEGGGRRGWLLLRQSLHDPLLVLNVESELPAGCAATSHRLLCWMEAVRACAPLDKSALSAAYAPGGKYSSWDAEGCDVYYDMDEGLAVGTPAPAR